MFIIKIFTNGKFKASKNFTDFNKAVDALEQTADDLYWTYLNNHRIKNGVIDPNGYGYAREQEEVKFTKLDNKLGYSIDDDEDSHSKVMLYYRDEKGNDYWMTPVTNIPVTHQR